MWETLLQDHMLSMGGAALISHTSHFTCLATQNNSTQSAAFYQRSSQVQSCLSKNYLSLSHTKPPKLRTETAWPENKQGFQLYLLRGEWVLQNRVRSRIWEGDRCDGAQHIQRLLSPHKIWHRHFLEQCGLAFLISVIANMVMRQETYCHQQMQHMTQYSKSIWCFSKVTSGDCPLNFKTKLEGPEKDCTPHDAASAYSPSTHLPPAKK